MTGVQTCALPIFPQDAPRYTQAGQTFPEASPRDRLLIDRHVRFVGDVVAIVAGKDEKCVDKALRLIKVEYEVLDAVLDYHTAKDNPGGMPDPTLIDHIEEPYIKASIITTTDYIGPIMTLCLGKRGELLKQEYISGDRKSVV